ncbi:YgaP family membrane protein [Tenuifilum sp.]
MLIALVIAGVRIYYQSWWGLLAIVPLANALTWTCGLHSLLGINTCSSKK